MIEIMVDNISPDKIPNTAIVDNVVTFLGTIWLKKEKVINTIIIRPSCSANCVIPGINAFCLPRKYPFMQLCIVATGTQRPSITKRLRHLGSCR